MSERVAVVLTFVLFVVLGLGSMVAFKLLGASDELLAFLVLPILAAGSYAQSAVTAHYYSQGAPEHPSVFGARRHYSQRRRP